jgi:hypothetical protein
MRLPFGNNTLTGLSPSPRASTPNARTKSFVLRRNSRLCRSVGVATRTSDPGTVYARCTAFAAVTVDLPHCREQFKIPRLAEELRTAACLGSGWKDKRSRAKSAGAQTRLAAGTFTTGRGASRNVLKEKPPKTKPYRAGPGNWAGRIRRSRHQHELPQGLTANQIL